MTSPGNRPQEVVERALAESTADRCVVLVRVTGKANLRWANNTLTTNGVSHGTSVSVICVVDGAQGAAAAALSRDTSTWQQLHELVSAADAAARLAGPAADAGPLVEGGVASDWEDEPATTTIDVYGQVAPALGEAFGRARADDRLLYGFVDHEVTTTYLGSSTGLRLRHAQPTGHVGITGKSTDLTRSAWVGQATRDFTDVDPLALDAELARRLAWAERKVDLGAGRYDTVLPPTAVADLMIYAYWSAGARDAHDGKTVFGRAGGGTRVGDRLSPHPIRLLSDPAWPGMECAPFTTAVASSSDVSVFDNGLSLDRTEWMRDGTLAALVQPRHGAARTGLPAAPGIDNLVLEVDGATGGVDDLVAGVDDGLLLTCLWYIREVDAQTLLLTGLTRDGVYLVEGGEVVGAVTNFRFNESPIDLLGRITSASATVPGFSREWGDYFPRTAMPALRIADFNMSSVSEAS
ncbi:MAG: TldD/PmbA family protein [Nocardioidaceae bacterium]|nr:TldD/PmbA family protein [Nocardioidaceae bacterium]